jgi:acyl-CoA synthetase (NDP forming)
MTEWTDAQMASIHQMLNPRSIAIVGATPRLQYGGRMLAAALKAKDRVRVYPVNPKYDEVMDTRCYPSVSDLPEAPDVVGIVVPYNHVLEVLKESHRKGVRAAVVISAGFSERGVPERRELQRQLGEYALESGLRISGPNCLGLANVKDDIWISSSSRGADGLSGSVGLVCQSGASAFGPFLVRAVDMGVGFSYIISTGNEADLDFCDFARYLLDDNSTKVIAGFVEGFKDGKKFIQLAKLAAQRGKPIVLIKIGRSELGSQAARSHTAAMTGQDAVYDAAMDQYGVIRVQDYDELLEVSQLLAQSPRPPKPGVAVVSHSGGISSLTADMCGQAGLDLPQLTDRARDGINDVLKGFGWAANPSDITGFANSDSFPEIMRHMIDEPEVGTLVVASSGSDVQARQVIAQRDLARQDAPASPKAVAFLWTGSRGATDGLGMLKSAQIPIFYVPNRLASGLKTLLDHHQNRDGIIASGAIQTPGMTAAQSHILNSLKGLGHQNLSEHDAKKLLSAWEIPITVESRVTGRSGAVSAATAIGYPVALKLDSPDLLHKTEAGAVSLNLAGPSEVEQAYERLMSIQSSGLSVNGVLVQEMVAGAVEVIVGVSYDHQLGPVLLFGAGGVMVEVMNDVALRLCPIDSAEAMAMINQVKGSRLLRGFRGRPAADVPALAETLVKVSHLAVNLEGQLSELDINPLMVLPQGQGVKAADALVTFVN